MYHHPGNCWVWENNVCSGLASVASVSASGARSASIRNYIRGFFLNDYITDIPSHLSRLVQLYKEGRLRVQVDLGEGVEGGLFRGLEAVCGGVDHLYSGCSRGKVVVEIALDSTTAKL